MTFYGVKRAKGVPETIIAHIVAHKRYFELFAQTAHIGILKRPADLNYLNDINPKAVAYLQTVAPRDFNITCMDALALLESVQFFKDDFIFLDPPYVADSRRSDRKLYAHEMLDEAIHVKLLHLIKRLRAKIMICTKQCDLYDQWLIGWNKVEIKTIDRTGKVYYEVIYMNYDAKKLRLHQYDYIGKDKTERQLYKRTIKNMTKKLETFAPHLREGAIKSIVERFPDIAHTFLSAADQAYTKTNTTSGNGIQK